MHWDAFWLEKIESLCLRSYIALTFRRLVILRSQKYTYNLLLIYNDKRKLYFMRLNHACASSLCYALHVLKVFHFSYLFHVSSSFSNLFFKKRR
jgi:hypothetical protein